MEGGSCSARGSAQVEEPNSTDPPPDPETFARSYQLEALEKAKKENTIVFLETGSGKTLIAVMLLRSYAFAIRKPSRYIAVFLVPTVVLVTQQAKVIEMHTALKVGKFWGEMGVDFWDADTWKENLEGFEVFVMTPQILLDNLRHTFFKLSDIKLIIFDECHHARGRHPYACVMMEFYHRHLESSSCELPRIFGMTASLVYSNGSNSHVARQIQELENLMNSKVYTVDSESILSAYISFPTPKIKLYEHIDSVHQQFIPVVEHLKVLKTKHIGAIDKQDSLTKTSLTKKISKLHATFVYCLRELGAWLALKAAKSLTCSQNYLFFWGQNVDEAGENAIKAFIQEVFQVLSSYLPQEIYIGDDVKENVDSGLLSSKTECLVKSLLEYRDLQELRCIIFVERIITAIVIHSLLGDIKGFSGRTKYMAGSKKLLHSQSRKEQTKIVDSFHDGKVNVIVATQILEEGLDVHGCNLVIRFDPAASSCSFIQSRGRARMKGSDYLILIRRGDTATMSKVVNFLKSGDVMREESRKQSFIPCKSLQTNMLLDEIYCVESTGAIVTMNSSVALIHFYCSRLPSDEYFRPQPRFEFEKDSNKCTLCLPKSSPIQVVHAECSSSMQKQLLCLEACKKLHAVGALNDYLLPASDVEIEDTQLSEVEPYNNEQADYFPSDLVDSWFSFCCLGLYHCYKITIDQHFNYDFAFDDMMLIVKTDLGSNFLSYSFGLKDSRGPVSVQLNYSGIVHLSREQVTMAKSFQISIFNILLHRDYSKLMDSLDCLHKNQISTAIAYLLVPLVGGRIDWQCVKSSFFHTGIVKDTVHSCVSKGSFSIVQTMSGPVCGCMLQHCIVYTPHSGKFYCVNGFLSDLNINSTFMLKHGRVLSYKEYFQSRHDVVLTCENQPLLSGRHLFKAENYLHKRSFRMEKVNSDAAVELPPELCTIIMSPISANTVYTFSFAPSIMHRIQCLLLASRLKKNILTDSMQNIDVPLSEVLEAITTDNCQEEFSLESLETLGDSFLKYAVNQNLFRAYKHHHEGILSAKKDKLVSNVALCRLGCDRHFPGFIRNRQFDPQEWFIPGSCVDHFEETTLFPDSSCTYTSRTRIIKGKVIADTVEALIGVFLTAAGEKAALKFIEWLGIKMEFHQETTPERKDLLKYEMYMNKNDLQLLLNYSFRNPTLLLEALTHASYQLPDVPGCYQRLEFLGDAVLDFLMTWYLYNKYPGLSPHMLTELRSANVSNDCYARAAIRAGLNKHILHASVELHKRTTRYLEFCANNLAASSDVSDASADPPKVLGDIIESIAGAIFVDSGYNKEIVWDSMKPLLEPLVSPETVELNPVHELDLFCSNRQYQLAYKMTIQNHTSHMTAEVEAEGRTHTATVTGPNKKTAKRMAAKALLRDLKSQAASES